MKPFSLDGQKLMLDGALAFAAIERTGIRVDVPYLKNQYVTLDKEVLKIEKELWRTKEAKEWKSRFKDKASFTSPTQLSHMLFKEWGYKPTKETRKGNDAVDYDVLRKIGTPFTTGILQMRKIIKVKDTYILGLLKAQTGGFLHPSFHLHTVLSFRSSSSEPNFQNQPVRDPFQGDVVRRAFLPLEPGHQFGEIDYKGNEVVSNACYSRDPNLISYIKDQTKDMHRDVAMECFLLRQDQVGKKIRYVGKNGFTFAEFYGSYFENIAPAMWEAIDEYELKTEDGVPLHDHLKSKKISSLSQFTDHIEMVENDFWEKKFPVHAEWKRQWYDNYLRNNCSFDLLTGFRCQGPMRKNAVCNYPGQGTGFHFVLWGMIQLHQWLVANEMESRIVGQIHDSIEISFHPDELQTVLQKARQIMTIDIRKHWPWICVPMQVDAEVAPMGKTWRDKKPLEIES
jgi:DNA polymerase-1